MSLFGASVLASATLRFPVKARNAGFFICPRWPDDLARRRGAPRRRLALRGRIDLLHGRRDRDPGPHHEGGQPTGEVAALGFDLRLDRFQAPRTTARSSCIRYYEQADDQRTSTASTCSGSSWRASIPDQAKNRLPSGDSFRLKGIYPDFLPFRSPETATVAYGTASQEWRNPAVVIEVDTQRAPEGAAPPCGVARPRCSSPRPAPSLREARRGVSVSAPSTATATAGPRASSSSLVSGERSVDVRRLDALPGELQPRESAYPGSTRPTTPASSGSSSGSPSSAPGSSSCSTSSRA